MKKIISMVIAICMLITMVPTMGTSIKAGETSIEKINNPRLLLNKGVAEWDCVYFGKYPQSSDGKGGFKTEPIKWRVISVKDNDAFLMADKALDFKAFDTSGYDSRYNSGAEMPTWERCTLRSWLNGYGSDSNIAGEDFKSSNFIDTAFTSAEKEAIYTSTVDTDTCYNPGTWNKTSDKVYLLNDFHSGHNWNRIGEAESLSVDEMMNRQFDTDYIGRCEATDYTIEKGCKSICDWWYSGPGCTNGSAACKHAIYSKTNYGPMAQKKAIRPVLHLNLSADVWTNCGTVQSNYEEEKSTTINITSFEELKSAVNVANENKGEYIFNVQKDFEISADEQVELSQSVVTLKGNGHSITVDTVADSYNPTEIYSSYVFVVKGEAKLNICTADGNDSIKLLNTNNKERRYSDKQIRRISVASKKGVINIYKGTYSELGYAIAGKLNVYGGTFTNFDGPYLSKSGFRLTSVISTYSADKNESTAEVNIFGGTFEDNYARAINIEGNSKCLIQGKSKNNPVIIKENHTGYSGTGLTFTSNSTLSIENVLFESNDAGPSGYRGGDVSCGSAAHITGGTVTINNSEFKSNHEALDNVQSGVIHSAILINGSKFSIDNCNIANNKESGIGLINNAVGTIKDSVICESDFSGIEMRGAVECNIKNTRITKNGQTSNVAYFGGGILSNAQNGPSITNDDTCSKTNIINCDEDTVICNNKSRKAGSDIYAKNTKLSLPKASNMNEKFGETDNDIDGWYYDGEYVSMGPSEGLERFGETNEPVLVDLEPNEAKDYSIIAGYNYSKWIKVASHPADYYQKIYNAYEQTEVGVWKLNVYDTGDCSGSMSYCGDGKAFRDLKIRIDKPYTGTHRGKGSMYGLSARADFKVNDPTKEYNYTVVFKSNREGTADIGTSIRGVDVFKYDEKITVGENIITGTFSPNSWEYGSFVFCPIDLPEGTIIDFTEFILEEVSSKKDAPSGFACKEVDDNVMISWLDYDQVKLYVDDEYYGKYSGGNVLLPKDDLGYGEHTFKIAGVTNDQYRESKMTESVKLQLEEKFKIKYNLEGGIENENPREYTPNSDDIVLKRPTRKGYIFNGWTGEGETNALDVTIKKGSKGNKEYTANWVEEGVWTDAPKDWKFNLTNTEAISYKKDVVTENKFSINLEKSSFTVEDFKIRTPKYKVTEENLRLGTFGVRVKEIGADTMNGFTMSLYKEDGTCISSAGIDFISTTLCNGDAPKDISMGWLLECQNLKVGDVIYAEVALNCTTLGTKEIYAGFGPEYSEDALDAPSGFACKEVDDNIMISWLDYNQVNLYVDNKYYGTYNGGNILLPKEDLSYGEHTFEIAGITDDPYGESKRTESIKLEITIKQPTDFSAYNFVDNNGTYKLKFKPGDEDVDTYTLSVDDENNDVTTFSTKDLKLDKKGFYTVDIDAGVLEKYAKEMYKDSWHNRYYAPNLNWEIHDVYLKATDGLGGTSEVVKYYLNISKKQMDDNDISQIHVYTNTDIVAFYDKRNAEDWYEIYSGEQYKKEITKEKTPASLTVKSKDGKLNNVSETGTIKVRGNSTAQASKKSYNISFDSKQQLMPGAKAGKKWCLLANAYDKSLMRNKLAMDLGKAIGGVAVPEEQYVDLYINGTYVGNYVLSEPADNGRSGVEYNEGSEDNPSKDIAFELDNHGRDSGEIYIPNTSFKTEDLEDLVKAMEKVDINDLSSTILDDNSEFMKAHPEYKWQAEKYKALKTTIDEFQNDLDNPSSDKLLEYIDVESFASMYIVAELFKVVDFGYSSVKYYVTYDEKGKPTIHAGALWDYDLSAGNSGSGDPSVDPEAAEREGKDTTEGFRSQDVNYWFGQLMKNPTFKKKVIQKFKNNEAVIQNLYKHNDKGDSLIIQYYNHIKASVEKNYMLRWPGPYGPVPGWQYGGAGWDVSEYDAGDSYYSYGFYHYSYDPGGKDYNAHLDFLKNWLEKRHKWIMQQWEKSDEIEHAPVIPKTSDTEGKEEPTTVPSSTTQNQRTETARDDALTKNVEETTNPIIELTKMTANKVLAKDNALKITWNKKSNVTGYEIQYSLKKNFKKSKTIKIKKNSTTSKTIRKLKNKKKYYVRIRSYKVVDGKIYRSAWSKRRSIKTK